MYNICCVCVILSSIQYQNDEIKNILSEIDMRRELWIGYNDLNNESIFLWNNRVEIYKTCLFFF